MGSKWAILEEICNLLFCLWSRSISMDLNTLSTTATGVPYVVATAGDPFDLNLFAIDSSVTTIGFEA